MAEVIAEAGYAFVKANLRYADVKIYWRQLLNSYAKLLKFEVELAADVHQVTTAQHIVVDKQLKLSPTQGRDKAGAEL